MLTQQIGDVDSFCHDGRRIADGGTVLDSDVVSAMVTRASRDGDGVGLLTPRPQQRRDRPAPRHH